MSGITQALFAVSAPVRPLFQSAKTASAAGGSSSLTINKPASVASGDLLIAVLVGNAPCTWNTLSGWTSLFNTVADPAVSVQYRFATGSEGASFAFTHSGSTRSSGTIMRFTKAASCNIGSSSAGTGSVQTAPSVTIANSASIVLAVFTADLAGATWTGVRTNAVVSFNTQCSFNVSYDDASAGATGTYSATMSASDTYCCFQIGISN